MSGFLSRGNPQMAEEEKKKRGGKYGTPRMLIITCVFEEKSMSTLQDKNQALQECLYLPTFLNDVADNKGRNEMTRFLILSMAGTTATF